MCVFRVTMYYVICFEWVSLGAKISKAFIRLWIFPIIVPYTQWRCAFRMFACAICVWGCVWWNNPINTNSVKKVASGLLCILNFIDLCLYNNQLLSILRVIWDARLWIHKRPACFYNSNIIVLLTSSSCSVPSSIIKFTKHLHGSIPVYQW